MNECPECGAPREWKTNSDATKFLVHPLGGCHEYIKNKLKNKCYLFDQDFGTPMACKEDCDDQIYCFETQIGNTPNKIYFNTPGPPWIRHDCKIKPTLVAQVVEYKPCVIDLYVSCNSSSPFGKQHFLGFQIQIEADGFRQKTLVKIQNQKDNKQFVRQLHQPFFYKEIIPHIWVLNTYQKSFDARGRLLCVPKEYKCQKIDHESIKGWKDSFGDENQHSLDF
jgi:hypothetical protein